jgi:hypothetical protein
MPTPDYADPRYIGYVDYVVIALLVVANMGLVKQLRARPLGCLPILALLLLYGLLLPFFSQSAELERTRRPPGVMVDSFELLYTYFRFPLYWALFVLQAGFLVLLNSRNKQTSSSAPTAHP